METDDVNSEEKKDLPSYSRRHPKKKFSSGFCNRMNEFYGQNKNEMPKYSWNGLSQECTIDYSPMSKDEAIEFAKNMFELYYTDKSVKRLIFEKNQVKFIAGYLVR